MTILDNNVYELAKQFTVRLTTSDPQADIMPAVAMVTIQDVDGKLRVELYVSKKEGLWYVL